MKRIIGKPADAPSMVLGVILGTFVGLLIMKPDMLTGYVIGVLFLLAVGVIIASAVREREKTRGVLTLQLLPVTGKNLQELLKRWENGERSVKLMLNISFTYIEIDQPEQAIPYAAKACQQFDIETLKHRRFGQRILVDNAYLALASAHVYQGKFTEAAYILDTYRPHAYMWNTITTHTALTYLLAGNEERARAVVDDLKPVKITGYQHSLAPHRAFIAAYLRYRLRGEDTRAQLQKQDTAYRSWLGDLSSHQNPTYRAQMKTILEDICPFLTKGWYYRLVLYMTLNQVEDLIADYQAKWEQGDHTLHTALTLAMIYGHLGDGPAAEPFARAALATLTADESAPTVPSSKQTKGDSEQRFTVELVHLVVYDALMHQGRFAEAGEILEQCIRHSKRPSLMYISIAQANYLAGDADQARTMLNRAKLLRFLMLTPQQQLLAAYLEYKLGLADSPDRIIATQDYLPLWDEDIARMVDNPYRRALQDMVADIRAITGSDSPAPSA